MREDAEKRGKMIKAASERHARPDEACKLIGSFGQAELKMIKYVEANAAKCGIPPQIGEQLKAGHKNTEVMLQKVCAAAQQQAQGRGPAGPSLSEVLGSAAALPEATATKKGGSTFDTLNGNVARRDDRRSTRAARRPALLTRPATGSIPVRRSGRGPICGLPVSTGRSDPGCC